MTMLSVLAALLPIVAKIQAQDWDGAYEKADAALSKLNLTEKVGISTGLSWQAGPCVGNVKEVPSIGYPSLCLQDGPLGLRFVQPATVFPPGINAAATWDANLIRDRGTAMGTEAKAWGVHVQLGPVVGPMGKIPSAGRNWEGFSPDPYLAGRAVSEAVTGMQSAGVQACVKHFLLNEQEKNRETMSSNVDDRRIHELYLWPFADAVKAGVASIMCSYNKINGSWACENEQLMNGLLKDELDFKGYIVSDWNAQHTTTGSANAGLDMTQPGSDFNNPPGSFFWGKALEDAVANGSVPAARVDDMARRNLAAWYLLEQDQNYPQVNWSSWKNFGRGGPDLTPQHKELARQIARDSIVLLKNTNATLPLGSPASLAIIGQDAIVNPAGANACPDRGCNIGTLAQGWGSGSAEFPYLIAPLDAIKADPHTRNTTIITSITDGIDEGVAAANQSELAVVFITAASGEGYINVEGNQGDRNNLDPWHNGNELVKAVASVKPTIVVIHSVGPVLLETILAQPNVLAIAWAGLPGQESGNALVDVMFGSSAPSGKLPYTIGKSAEDYGTSIAAGDDSYPEGIYIDYRHFDKANIEPRFEFGFGLSYTTFEYSNITVSIDAAAGPINGPKAPGGAQDLYDTVGTLSLDIKNTGSVSGAEVAQLYLGYPSSTAADMPPKQLRGFTKLAINPGQSETATFDLRKKDVAYWDVASQVWVVPAGEFQVSVGSSSRDVRQTATFSAA